MKSREEILAILLEDVSNAKKVNQSFSSSLINKSMNISLIVIIDTLLEIRTILKKPPERK